jgi:hypothetical protein
MDYDAGVADGDLARGTAGKWANEGLVFRQTREERGDGIGVGGTQRLPVEQAQDLRPGAPGGAMVRLRAIAEVSQVATEYEGIDLVHSKCPGGSGVDTTEECVGPMPV